MKHIKHFEAKQSKEELSNKKDTKAAERKKLADEVKSLEVKYGIIHDEHYDWKEVTDSMFKVLKEVSKGLGGYFYDDPTIDGDLYGFIISKNPINKEELLAYAKVKNALRNFY